MGGSLSDEDRKRISRFLDELWKRHGLDRWPEFIGVTTDVGLAEYEKFLMDKGYFDECPRES